MTALPKRVIRWVNCLWCQRMWKLALRKFLDIFSTLNEQQRPVASRWRYEKEESVAGRKDTGRRTPHPPTDGRPPDIKPKPATGWNIEFWKGGSVASSAALVLYFDRQLFPSGNFSCLIRWNFVALVPTTQCNFEQSTGKLSNDLSRCLRRTTNDLTETGYSDDDIATSLRPTGPLFLDQFERPVGDDRVGTGRRERGVREANSADVLLAVQGRIRRRPTRRTNVHRRTGSSAARNAIHQRQTQPARLLFRPGQTIRRPLRLQVNTLSTRWRLFGQFN